MRGRERRRAPRFLTQADRSLLDLVDHALNKGVVVAGDVTLGLANVDLIYLRLSVLLCAADRVLGDGRRRRGRADAPPRRRPRRADGRPLPLRASR